MYEFWHSFLYDETKFIGTIFLVGVLAMFGVIGWWAYKEASND